MRKLKMTIGGVAITAELFDTPTADAIYQNLPFSSTARTWGEEVYFDTPVSSEIDLFATNLYVLEDGQWKIIHHQAGAAPPPEEEESGPLDTMQ